MSIDTDQATVDRWLTAGTWVQFREGESAHTDWCSGDPRWMDCECWDSGNTTAPADWEADQKCETCRGEGSFTWPTRSRDTSGRPVSGVRTEPCERCNGTGLRRHAVTVPCPHPSMAYTDGTVCRVRNCSGRITDAWATVKWGPLPVVGFHRRLANVDQIELSDGTRIDLPLVHNIDPYVLDGQWARGGTLEVAT